MHKKNTLAVLIGCILSASLAQAEHKDVKPQDQDIETLVVEGERLSGINTNEVKSADLADALNRLSASVSLVRRSGIANDVILRGQKKDNINILIDDAKIHGACPNRMDPPTSHVLTNNVESVEITEGPYDVENFGTLSGMVKVNTRKPEEGLRGDLSLNVGSWGYQKLSASVSGGNDKVRMMVGASSESSEQYEDGDGNNFAEQIANYDPTSMARMKPEYADMDAYDKKTFMGKLYLDLAENQELMVSYTANRSDDVLYPTSPMDAIYDDSDLFNLEYKAEDLASWSKRLEVQLYDSYVDHPMSTYYRMSSGPNSANQRTNHMESEIMGGRVKNVFDLDQQTEMSVGLDTSRRNWDGRYEGDGMASFITGIKSIDDTDTDNIGLFVELNKDYNDFNLQLGARYDDTTITPGHVTQMTPENDYNGLGGYVFGTYQLQEGLKLFGGIGRASRVPDARELYFVGAPMMPGSMPMMVGNPNLDETTNTEIDLGIETELNGLDMKAKVFYSDLGDFIFYNDSLKSNKFENMDAKLWGFDLTGSYHFSKELYADFGIAWQRGEKDHALTNQTGTDMPEIPPLKGTLALNYDYSDKSTARVEVVGSDNWSRFDFENGEQALDGWAVMNLKARHFFTDNFGVTVGVDNVFDDTYAVSNTYKDLTLLTGGVDGEVMLMNEPGRYFYLNATYSF